MKKHKKLLLIVALFIAMIGIIFLYSLSYVDSKKFQQEYTYIGDTLTVLD